MNYLKVSIGIFLALSVSRFIPHPPNFTSLIALSFYVPAIFGTRYISIVVFSLILTDFIIGFHATIMFTWGSIILIGLIAKYFVRSTIFRISGALTGAILFFILTNFGVWLSGYYGYNFEGLILCYTLAIPFFTSSVLSTLIFSMLIEFVLSFYQEELKKIKKLV
jgi:hypothetical protein